LNKQDFIEDLALRCDFSKAEAGRALEAVLDSITEALQEGDEVALTGFGRFLTQKRKGRQGVDPRNPTRKIKIAAATVPKFPPRPRCARP